MTHLARHKPLPSGLINSALRRIRYILVLLIVAGLAYSALYTKQGVHTVFTLLDITDEDYPGDITPDDPPVEFSANLEVVRTVPLPDNVLQPSGISWSADGSSLLIATDQAELFSLDGLTFEQSSEVKVKNAPLLFRQGQIETVAYVDGYALLAGGYDEIDVWHNSGSGWARTASISLTQPGMSIEGDVTAIAYDPDTGRLYLADESTSLHVLDRFGAFQHRVEITTEDRPGRLLSEMELVGMEFINGMLIAVAEYFNTVLLIDPVSGAITDAFRLESISKPSGIAMNGSELIVTIDHEYDEPSPGLKVFSLPKPLRPSHVASKIDSRRSQEN